MKTRKTRTAAIGWVILGVVLGIVSYQFLIANAGDLEPTAPPGPTMKTLDEVEPRIPIPGSSTPATPFAIDSPGSYYLTGDRHCSGTGIVISTDNVTIDLMGYSLIGPGSGINHGINMTLAYGRENVEIRNGTIREFGEYGIYDGGLYASQTHRVIGVRAIWNDTGGIYLKGYGHLVKGCTASYNGIGATGDVYGIYIDVGGGATVTGNVVLSNGNYAGGIVYGVYAIGEDNTVTDNMVRGNGNQANYVYGIRAGTGSTVTGNTANNNGYSASSSVWGIWPGNGSTVTGNTADNNGHAASGFSVTGILAGSGCTVTGNTAYGNGILATGTVYGIYPSASNLVDQNTSHDNNTSGSGINMNINGTCTFGVNEY